MSKFNFYFIALASLSILFSCNKSDDDETVVPIRGFSEQYATDLSVIQTYLQKHYIKEIVNNPGGVDDQDIKFAEIDDTTTQVPIWDSPMLHSFVVQKHDIEYTIYYLQLREGVGEAPTRVDKVLTAYEGSYLFAETKQDTIDGVVLPDEPTTSSAMFETVQIPTNYFELNSTIVGFSEVFPLFKPGELAPEVPGSPASYLNFGAGVMFIPSGLGYFNYSTTTIPSYSPLMFKFKFYSMQRGDSDADGILSIDEDINHNGDFTDDDTDGDGIQNFMDTDDDGDGYTTKIETKYTFTYTVEGTEYQITEYYPHQGAAVDDPDTVYDDTKGVPDCAGDFTTPTRLRKYLDPSCH